LCRQKLALQYATKLKSSPLNPAYSCGFSLGCKVFFDARPTVVPTMGIQVLPQLSEASIDLDCIARTSVCATPPWRLQTAMFLYTLYQLGNKNQISPDLFKSKFRETLKAFDDYEHIYTDASKVGSAVAAAALSRLGTRVKRLPDDASIFSGVVQAILLALDMAEQAGCRQVLFMADFLSCLQSIKNQHLSNALVLKIITWVHGFLSSGHKITFM
jgi:hypothetical protein